MGHIISFLQWQDKSGKGIITTMGYSKDALSGFSAQTFLKIALAGLTIAKMSVVARLLTPTDFGIFSLIAIALGVTEATTETGINVTMLQSKNSVEYFVDTAWVIAIVRGFIIGSLMVGLGFFFQSFFNIPNLLFLISLAALVPVIKGFINPAIVILRKNLQFFWDGTYRLSLAITEALLAVGLCLFVRSSLSLVLALIGAAIFEVLISFVFFSLKPRFGFIQSRASVIFHNSKWLSFSALFNYLHENLDNFLVGKLASAYSLGLYQTAYSMGHKVNYEFAKSTVHSTLPIFTKLTETKNRLQRAFWRSSIATLGFSFLASLPLLFFPKFFVQLVLGDQWLELSKYLYLMVIAGFLQAGSSLIYNFFIAQKKYFYINFHMFCSVLFMVVAISWLTPIYGVAGAAAGIVISRTLTLPLLIYPLYRWLTSYEAHT